MLKSLRRTTTDDDGRRRTTDDGRHAMTIAHFEPMAQYTGSGLSGTPWLFSILDSQRGYHLPSLKNKHSSKVKKQLVKQPNKSHKLRKLKFTNSLWTDALGIIDGKNHMSKPQARKKRSYRPDKLHKSEYLNTIPSEYIVVVRLGAPVSSVINKTTLNWLKGAFASYLKLSTDNVEIYNINYRGNIIEMYFLKDGEPLDLLLSNNMMKNLIPAKNVVKPDLLNYLQKELPAFNITFVHAQHDLLITTYTRQFWSERYFPYVAAAGSVSFLVITAILIYCCCRKKTKDVKAEKDISKSQQIFYPSIKPDIKGPAMIQPEGAPVYVTKGCATPIQTQTMRIKKGLLERRGSSASLTLDLNASPEMGRWDGTPPKESTGLEFLLSAGNRLSRRDLRNAVKNSRALYEEFWEIPMNHPEKVQVAGSGMKNRYKTIIPNEHSRVVLPDSEWDPLSSYINANYIRGYDGEPHTYIATQGPMSHTIVDFWRMVWHDKCPIIVMITKLKEKSRPKCENYLPDDNTWCTFGDVDVKVDRVVNKHGYTLRHLLLRCNSEMQHVLHYWYTAWPDHKPPDSPTMLLELVKEVELRRYRGDGIRSRGPVIVHCSAGIGRTGCFVAISIGIRQLREEHSVDALGIVCSMRIDRGGMIQTHEQYEFIHQALCAYEKSLGEPLTNSWINQK
ncbi:hypothetical protein FSP39_011876 [Pinctada imbricata]|uniref:protein-tyrosine-phosphatase n=1 Tax=Pinctada imbricata TaxID=66713 RepID=A0AA88YD34_PINIB|nr:hypothetical protein FSP39_011876 [Pinctada imbricata]